MRTAAVLILVLIAAVLILVLIAMNGPNAVGLVRLEGSSLFLGGVNVLTQCSGGSGARSCGEVLLCTATASGS